MRVNRCIQIKINRFVIIVNTKNHYCPAKLNLKIAVILCCKELQAKK